MLVALKYIFKVHCFFYLEILLEMIKASVRLIVIGFTNRAMCFGFHRPQGVTYGKCLFIPGLYRPHLHTHQLVRISVP